MLRTRLTNWNLSIFQIQSVPRQAHVLSPGTPIQDLLFVSDGLLRLYFLSEDGTETNMAFVIEETFACPLSTFSLNQPVAFGIQSLEWKVDNE